MTEQYKTKISIHQVRETKTNEPKICDVWSENFLEEMDRISRLIDYYNVIALVRVFKH